jgi:hypothetical protein
MILRALTDSPRSRRSSARAAWAVLALVACGAEPMSAPEAPPPWPTHNLVAPEAPPPPTPLHRAPTGAPVAAPADAATSASGEGLANHLGATPIPVRFSGTPPATVRLQCGDQAIGAPIDVVEGAVTLPAWMDGCHLVATPKPGAPEVILRGPAQGPPAACALDALACTP